MSQWTWRPSSHGLDRSPRTRHQTLRGRPNWIDYAYKSRWGCSILIPQGPPYYSFSLSPRKLDTIDHLYSPLSQGKSYGINGRRLCSLELVKPATYPITLPMRAPVANARRLFFND